MSVGNQTFQTNTGDYLPFWAFLQCQLYDASAGAGSGESASVQVQNYGGDQWVVCDMWDNSGGALDVQYYEIAFFKKATGRVVTYPIQLSGGTSSLPSDLLAGPALNLFGPTTAPANPLSPRVNIPYNFAPPSNIAGSQVREAFQVGFPFDYAVFTLQGVGTTPFPPGGIVDAAITLGLFSL
jgi:hypothetical protein